MVQMNTKETLFAIILACKKSHFIFRLESFVSSSELAQKTRAEREAKRILHETGVAKKKEIITNAAAIKQERQVEIYCY